MQLLRLIRNTSDLRGTCYFEFLPGKYKKKCWNDESVFLDEETFALIEPIIARHERGFDHYSFVEIQRHTWIGIIIELKGLVLCVRGAGNFDILRRDVEFIFKSSEREFAKDFQSNAEALANMICELVEWLQEQLTTQECVCVLGM